MKGAPGLVNVVAGLTDLGKPKKSNQDISETRAHFEHRNPRHSRQLVHPRESTWSSALPASAPPHEFYSLCSRISESSISTAELMPLEENSRALTAGGDAEGRKGGLWTRVKVGSSHWNPTQARAVTDREMTGVPRGLGGSREITQCHRLLQEWLSRQADLCYLGGCVLPLHLFPNY